MDTDDKNAVPIHKKKLWATIVFVSACVFLIVGFVTYEVHVWNSELENSNVSVKKVLGSMFDWFGTEEFERTQDDGLDLKSRANYLLESFAELGNLASSTLNSFNISTTSTSSNPANSTQN